MTKSIAQKMGDIQKNELGKTPTFDVEELLGQENIVHLTLDTQIYVLRRTRQNKLLLTK